VLVGLLGCSVADVKERGLLAWRRGLREEGTLEKVSEGRSVAGQGEGDLEKVAEGRSVAGLGEGELEKTQKSFSHCHHKPNLTKTEHPNEREQQQRQISTKGHRQSNSNLNLPQRHYSQHLWTVGGWASQH
jgi:hypothetical protein